MNIEIQWHTRKMLALLHQQVLELRASNIALHHVVHNLAATLPGDTSEILSGYGSIYEATLERLVKNVEDVDSGLADEMDNHQPNQFQPAVPSARGK